METVAASKFKATCLSLLENGVKEGLVESPLEWPGVHAARALVEGKSPSKATG